MDIKKPDWIPFYNELLNIICKNYDAESLYNIWLKYFPNKYKDIRKMDPFTFVSRTLSRQRENKFKNCENLKKDFGLKSDIPKHYEEPNGMPSLKGAYTFFCKSYRNLIIKDGFKESEAYKKALSPLWDLAKQVIDNNIKPETYNQCIKLTNAGPQLLTQIIFICNPNVYYSLDEINQNYLKNNGIKFSLESSYDSFIDFQLKAKQINPIPYVFSIKAYIETDKQHYKNENQKGDNNMKQPLNQILYGPPGTGKTYNTVVKAIQILDVELYKKYDAYLDELKKSKDFKIPKENSDFADYKMLQKRYNQLKEQGRIEFITFHQSYSYEEFVEGIKPYLKDIDNNENLKYELKDGIFKKICQKAKKELYQKKDNTSIVYADFDLVFNEFKNKYPEGTDFDKLINLKYSERFIKYKFGKQKQYRKIDLNKIKDIFNNESEYDTAIDFNSDYDGNHSLACYHYTFYKELNNIRKEINASIQNKINKNTNNEFQINKQAPKFILIIDEINRGNISKIFGELITLIETDKRIGKENELKITLPYSQQKDFGVPSNLYIIGTMNTSDRSIASVDIALRRRFKFVEMMPNSDLVAGFDLTDKKDEFKDYFKKINKKISILLDRDHQIGHSYFINTKYNNENENNNIETLKQIWFDSIIPLLNEYFYGDWDKLQAILGVAKKEDAFIKPIEIDKSFENNKFFKENCENENCFEFANLNDFNDNEKFKKALKNMDAETEQ